MHQDLNVWRTDKRAEGCISERGYSYIPHNLFGNKMRSVIKILKLQKESIFVMMWPWPLAHDHEKFINSGHYHYHCVFQIWKQSIQCFLSYCVNHLCGGWPQHKAITRTPTPTHPHPDPLTIWNSFEKNYHSGSNISQVTSQTRWTATNKWTRKHGSTIPQTNIEAHNQQGRAPAKVNRCTKYN